MGLLIYFAIPISIIILSAILERILNNPVWVAGITFSVLLIVTFAAFDINFLILTILYTMLSYIMAVFIKFLYYMLEDIPYSEKYKDKRGQERVDTQKVNTQVSRIQIPSMQNSEAQMPEEQEQSKQVPSTLSDNIDDDYMNMRELRRRTRRDRRHRY